MVMSSETKDIRELNGKKSSSNNSPLSSTKQQLDTPETSDDDSSKWTDNFSYSQITRLMP